jgi:hypothetical protein
MAFRRLNSFILNEYPTSRLIHTRQLQWPPVQPRNSRDTLILANESLSDAG